MLTCRSYISFDRQLKLLVSLIFQSAHMAVTESLMQLFVKESVSLDRMRNTVKRFATLDESGKEDPADPVSVPFKLSRK